MVLVGARARNSCEKQLKTFLLNRKQTINYITAFFIPKESGKCNNNLNYHRYYTDNKSKRHKNNHENESFYAAYKRRRRKRSKGNSTIVINESDNKEKCHSFLWRNHFDSRFCAILFFLFMHKELYHNADNTQQSWKNQEWDNHTFCVLLTRNHNRKISGSVQLFCLRFDFVWIVKFPIAPHSLLPIGAQ